jgi:hypothetical protein
MKVMAWMRDVTEKCLSNPYNADGTFIVMECIVSRGAIVRAEAVRFVASYAKWYGCHVFFSIMAEH